MKALSVKLPWWSRIEIGDKTLEVRSWSTKYRGPIIICASLGVDHEGMMRVGIGVAGVIKAMNRRGRAICVVDVVDCRPMVKADEAKAMVPYKPGLFVWVLANPRRAPGVPVKGKLGLFNVEMPADPVEQKFKRRKDGTPIAGRGYVLTAKGEAWLAAKIATASGRPMIKMGAGK